MVTKAALITLAVGASFGIFQSMRGASSPEQIGRADRVFRTFLKQIGQPVPVPKRDGKLGSVGKGRYGEIVVDLSYMNTSGIVEPLHGDVLYVSLPKDRSAGRGRLLSEQEILNRADRLAKLRIPDGQRHLFSIKLTPAGSPDLDISRANGAYAVVYRELPGQVPTLDWGNTTTMIFNASTGALQSYVEYRGFTKVGSKQPAITPDEAKRVVLQELQRVGSHVSAKRVVLGWSVVFPDRVPGATGRELRLSYEVRLSNDIGWRVDAQTGKLIGVMGKQQCDNWQLDKRIKHQ